ncbi:hypothetical protein BY458DRAFT_571238, partial [Sporodiniella umbellata]
LLLWQPFKHRLYSTILFSVVFKYSYLVYHIINIAFIEWLLRKNCCVVYLMSTLI